MDSWLTLAAWILGSSVITAVVTGLFLVRKNNADASKVLQELWHSELNRLKDDVKELEQKLNSREVVIETLKAENIQLRKELDDLKTRYAGQVAENKKLREEIKALVSENCELGKRISRLEGEVGRE